MGDRLIGLEDLSTFLTADRRPVRTISSIHSTSVSRLLSPFTAHQRTTTNGQSTNYCERPLKTGAYYFAVNQRS